MPQCLALDKGPRIPYYLLGGILAGVVSCHGLKSIAPVGLAPTESSVVQAWVQPYTPKVPTQYSLHWIFRNARGSVKNRAAVRIAPPDSLRLDFRGPFGKSGAAVVVGDSGVWAKPEGDLTELLKAAPLFWAALGIPRGPARNVQVSGLETPERRAWRYAGASDTFDFVEVRRKPMRLLAEMRRAGKIVGLAEAEFNEGGDHVVSSRLDFPEAESRFTFTVDSLKPTESFDTDIWRRP